MIFHHHQLFLCGHEFNTPQLFIDGYNIRQIVPLLYLRCQENYYFITEEGHLFFKDKETIEEIKLFPKFKKIDYIYAVDILAAVAEGMVYHFDDYINHPATPILNNNMPPRENMIEYYNLNRQRIYLNLKGSIYMDEYFTDQMIEKEKNVQQVAWNIFNVYFLKKNGKICWIPSGYLHEKKYNKLKELYHIRVKKIACGYDCLFALSEDGVLYTYGENNKGKLGLGFFSDKMNTISRIPILENIIDVQSSDTHTVALDVDGNYYAWGDNRCGQLGVGDNVFRSVPEYFKIQDR